MRIRTIKPEFWESESIGRLSRDARLLFIGLFNCCDDSGRARASSRLLASRLFPYDDDAFKRIPSWLSELTSEGCIRMYVIDGEQFLDVPKFLNHQKIDHPSASKLPPFQEGFARIREDSRNIALEGDIGNRELEQGGGGGAVKVKAVKINPFQEEFDHEWEGIRKSIQKVSRRNRDESLKAWTDRREAGLSREDIMRWWNIILDESSDPGMVPGFHVAKRWKDIGEIKAAIGESKQDTGPSQEELVAMRDRFLAAEEAR